MNLYFVRSGTADNYIMAETSEGVLCSNCAPTGEFAGVDLYGYDANGKKISDKLIAAEIADALDPDITEDDLAWMGDPCYPSIVAWEDEQKAAEPFNRDKAFFIGIFGAREISHRYVPDYNSSNLSSAYRFIRVTGEDGVFFDLVRDGLVAKHIAGLREGGYEAEKVARKAVPPCLFRNFGDDLSGYRDATWRGGGYFYHPQNGGYFYHPQKEEEKPSVQDRLKRGSSAKADAPKASTARKKEDPSR